MEILSRETKLQLPTYRVPWLNPKVVRQFWKYPLAFHLDIAKQLGPTYRLLVPGVVDRVFYSRADTIRQIVVEGESAFSVTEQNKQIEAMVGAESLFRLPPELHLPKKKMLLPHFTGAWLKRATTHMHRAAKESLQAIANDTDYRARDLGADFALRTIFYSTFGEHSNLNLFSTFSRLAELAANPLIYIGLPAPRFRRAHQKVHAILTQGIRRRRQEGIGDNPNTLLDLLALGTDAAGRSLQEQAIRDELVSLLFAGHETTATAFSWLVEEILLQPPSLWQRLIEETKGLDPADVVKGCPLLESCIKETLRLHPALLAIGRVVVNGPQILEGQSLPTGTKIGMNCALAHRNPEVFEQPLEFIPERFLDFSPPPYTYFPFGGGAHRCLGAAFTMVELKVMMLEFLKQPKPKLVHQRPSASIRRFITLAPENGVPLRP